MSFTDIFRDKSPIGTIKKIKEFGNKDWICSIEVIYEQEKLIGTKNILNEEKIPIGIEQISVSFYPLKEEYVIKYEKRIDGGLMKDWILEEISIPNNFKNRFNFEIMNLNYNRIKKNAREEKDYSMCLDGED